VLIDLPLG
jgi:hypothetical protein